MESFYFFALLFTSHRSPLSGTGYRQVFFRYILFLGYVGFQFACKRVMFNSLNQYKRPLNGVVAFAVIGLKFWLSYGYRLIYFITVNYFLPYLRLTFLRLSIKFLDVLRLSVNPIKVAP